MINPLRLLSVLCLAFMLSLGAAPAWAKSGGSKADIVKVPANYVALPKLRLAVQADENRQYRMLDLEAWVVFKTPEEAAKMGVIKASIAERMKTAFLFYKWEAFMDPIDGIELAKTIIKNCITDALKNGPEPDEVLVRQMIMR